MTDIELLTILESPRSNLEKAIAIRAALQSAAPSALNIKPKTERKKRDARKPQPSGHLDLTPHEEATP